MKQALLLSLFAALSLPSVLVSAFTSTTQWQVDTQRKILRRSSCSVLLQSTREDENLDDKSDKQNTSVSPLTSRKSIHSPQVARNRGRLNAVSVSEQDSIALNNDNPINQLSEATIDSLGSQTPSLPTGRALVVIASIVYGTNFATVKMINGMLPLGASALVRFALAAIVVTGFVLATENEPVSDDELEERTQSTLRGMEVGAWYAIGYIAQATSLLTQDASKNAFFNALAVIFVPFLSVLLGGKRLSFGTISAVLLAMMGTHLLESAPSSADAVSSVASSWTTGDWLGLAQAGFFGTGYWRLEQVSQAFPKQAGRVTAGQMIGVVLGTLIYSGATGQIPHLDQIFEWCGDSFIVGALLWTGLVSTALAIYLETVALQVVSATELSIIMTTTSVWASTFAYFTIGETLTASGMAGGALILSSCLVSTLLGGETTETEDHS